MTPRVFAVCLATSAAVAAAFACSTTLVGADLPPDDAGVAADVASPEAGDAHDASDAPLSPCTADMPFGEPVRVAGLDPPPAAIDRWPHLNADETEIFFGRSMVGSLESVVFMRATRDDRSLPFRGIGAIAVGGTQDGGLVAHPHVRLDGKALPFSGRATSTADYEVWIADRKGDSFENARRVGPTINTLDH